MVELVQDALRERGIDDQIIAVGQFNPRGHTGGLFVGGLLGSDAGGALGAVGESVGLGAGSLAGMKAADAASGLPANMLVGVSEMTVYGFAARTRHSEPTDLAFQVPREGVTAKVHQGVNVRVLELIDDHGGDEVVGLGRRQRLLHARGQA